MSLIRLVLAGSCDRLSSKRACPDPYSPLPGGHPLAVSALTLSAYPGFSPRPKFDRTSFNFNSDVLRGVLVRPGTCPHPSPKGDGGGRTAPTSGFDRPVRSRPDRFFAELDRFAERVITDRPRSPT